MCGLKLWVVKQVGFNIYSVDFSQTIIIKRMENHRKCVVCCWNSFWSTTHNSIGTHRKRSENMNLGKWEKLLNELEYHKIITHVNYNELMTVNISTHNVYACIGSM